MAAAPAASFVGIRSSSRHRRCPPVARNNRERPDLLCVRGLEWVLAHRTSLQHPRHQSLSLARLPTFPNRAAPMSAAVEIAWRRAWFLCRRVGERRTATRPPSLQPVSILVFINRRRDGRSWNLRSRRTTCSAWFSRLGHAPIQCQPDPVPRPVGAIVFLPARARKCHWILCSPSCVVAQKNGFEHTFPPDRNVDGAAYRVGRARSSARPPT